MAASTTIPLWTGRYGPNGWYFVRQGFEARLSAYCG